MCLPCCWTTHSSNCCFHGTDIFHKVVQRHTWGVVGSLVTVLLLIFSDSGSEIYSFENRLISGKVKAHRKNGANFFGPPCRSFWSSETACSPVKTMRRRRMLSTRTTCPKYINLLNWITCRMYLLIPTSKSCITSISRLLSLRVIPRNFRRTDNTRITLSLSCNNNNDV